MSALQEVLATTREKWIKKNPIDIHFPKNATLKKMWKNKVSYDGGTFLGVPVVVGGGTTLIAADASMAAASSMSGDLAAIAAAKTDVIRKISLPWKKAFAEADIEANALVRNRGVEEVIKLTEKRLTYARTQVADDMATFLFNGTGALKQWHGLPVIVSNLPYGNDEDGVSIDPRTNATFADWKARHVIASSQNYTGVTYTAAAPSVLTFGAAHGLVVNDQVEISETLLGDIPAGVYKVDTVPLATTVTLKNYTTGAAIAATVAEAVGVTVDKGASLTNNRLEEMWSEITDVEMAEEPDTILFSKLQYRLAKNRLGLQYFNRDGDSNVDFSVKSIGFMGIPISEERRVLDHTVYFLNTNHLHLGCTSDPDRQGQFGEFKHMSLMTANREDVFRTQAWIDANFVCTNRRAQGKISNILPS